MMRRRRKRSFAQCMSSMKEVFEGLASKKID